MLYSGDISGDQVFDLGGLMKGMASRAVALVVGALLLASCVTHNEYAMKIGAPPVAEGETVVSLRTIQERTFDTLETKRIVAASAATLQDLGFTVTTSSGAYGVLAASKERDAVEAGQVAGQVVLAILAGLAGSYHQVVYDESQKINASLLVNDTGNGSSKVRVIFDRHITNNQGILWKAEIIKEEEIYQEFFDKLSEGLFLEAHTS